MNSYTPAEVEGTDLEPRDVLPTLRGVDTVDIARGHVLGVRIALDALGDERVDGVTPRLPVLALRLCILFFTGEVALAKQPSPPVGGPIQHAE